MCDAVPDKQQAPGPSADAAQGLRHALLHNANQQAVMHARRSRACSNAYCAAQVLWYKLRDANPDASAQEVLAELARRLDDMRIQARKPAVEAVGCGAVALYRFPQACLGRQQGYEWQAPQPGMRCSLPPAEACLSGVLEPGQGCSMP